MVFGMEIFREKHHLEMSRLKMSYTCGVHRHSPQCFLLVEVFAIPGEPCYQILKMLSSLPRLPTRAEDMSPSRIYHSSLSSLFFVSFQMSVPSKLPFLKPLIAFSFSQMSILHVLFIPSLTLFHLLLLSRLGLFSGFLSMQPTAHMPCQIAVP